MEHTSRESIAEAPVVLKTEQLSVVYGPTVALHEVDLELVGGQLVGVIGPNGAGKSSLLKGMLEMVPLRGRVLVNGQPLKRMRRRLAYVPQRSEVRWDFPVTVEDVVMMGRYALIGPVGFPGKRDRAVVADSLKMVEMTEFRRQQISQLSGGQQQRVFLARALAQQGQIILLDEPLTGVDTPSQGVIMDLLKQLRQEGKLIIMATHDLNTAARECDQLCFINHRLIAYGPPAKVFKPDILAETYGGKVFVMPDQTGANQTATMLIQ